MIGTIDFSKPQAAIIGGGVSGLLAAYYLLQSGFDIDVYESGGRLGGLIRSDHMPEGLVERAAHSFRSGPAILDLMAALNVSCVKAQTHKKYIFRDKKLQRFPLRLHELVEMVWRIMTARAQSGQSMASWADHHFGRGARDALITPLLHGIYATHPEEALQELVFPILTPSPGHTLFAHLLRIPRAKPRPVMMAPKDGMGMLVDALATFVQNHPRANVHLNAPCTALPNTPNIILTSPAYESAKLLAQDAPDVAQTLANIPYAPLVAVTAFAHTQGKTLPQGVGVLMAAQEPCHALGVLFNASGLPHRTEFPHTASFTFMFGGTRNPQALDVPDEKIDAWIAQDYETIFGHAPDIQARYITRWPKALPVYGPALKTALHATQKNWAAAPGRILFGNYTGQISLRGLCQSAADHFTRPQRLPDAQ